MTRLTAIIKLAAPALLFLFLAGCGEGRRPVTIVFTGDTQGRLVPAG